jgi:hypothetical protein
MYRNVRRLRLLALVPLLSLSQFAACATINTGVDPEAKAAGVKRGARVHIRGASARDVTVYNEEGEKLAIRIVEDPTFMQALGNSMAQSAAENSGAATYTTTTRLTPAVFLSPKRDHTLRLVKNDGSTVVIQRPRKLGKRYFIIDWLIFAPTLGFSLAIDWATGQWNDFEDINVDEEFRKAAAQTTGARR